MVRVTTGHQVRYSDCSEKHELKSQTIIESPHRVEYCPISHFYKDGRGIIYYYDDHEVLSHVLLCNWSKGKIHGKGYLYDVKNNRITSILTFCEDSLVDEVDFCINESEPSIIDASDGSRWEGPCRNGKAYGRGTIYSDSNNMSFFGWCVDDERCGFGTVYHDLQGEELVPSMEGYWFHDSLYGRVQQYDFHGDPRRSFIMMDGEEISDRLVYFPTDLFLLYSFVKIVQIESNCGMDEMSVFDMSSCTQLVELHIGNNCFPKVKGFVIDGLRFLCSVTIGKDSFTCCNRLEKNPWKEPNPREIKMNRQSFKVCNCPTLTEFHCEEGCFSSFLSFSMFDLPSLKTLRIGVASEEEQFEQGSWSFFWCPCFCIRHLPSLEECIFGNYSFYYTIVFKIEDCVNLRRLHFGNHSFCNYNRKAADFSLRDLPSLQEMEFFHESFFNCNRVHLMNLGIEEVQVELHSYTFWNLKRIGCHSVNSAILNAFYIERQYKPSIVKSK